MAEASHLDRPDAAHEKVRLDDYIDIDAPTDRPAIERSRHGRGAAALATCAGPEPRASGCRQRQVALSSIVVVCATVR